MNAGYESARAITKANGRSFAFAAFALEPRKRWAAYAVYAFFRRLDDAFDNEESGETQARAGLIAQARAAVQWLYEGGAFTFTIWPRHEMDALAESIAAHALPRASFDDMIAGMQMDLDGHAYPDEQTLDLYCYRVAGTVGEIMATLLGAKERVALDAAVRLGRAMQLTNILRDVAEDMQRGRVYLPTSELQKYSVTLAQRDEHWRRFAAAHIQRARQLYESAREGIVRIDSFSGRWLVEMMSRIYGDILRAIEARGHDVFSGRARVSTPRKLWLACRAFFAAVRV